MNKGFTLFEILIVVSIIGILTYLSVPMGLTFYRSQAVNGAREQLVEVLTRARHNAVLQKHDSSYGVYIDTIGGVLSSFTIYRGNDYDTRIGDEDEVYNQSPNLTIDGDSPFSTGDINFAKLTGLASATGTITISNAVGQASESRSIEIDYFGNVTKN